MSLPSDAKDRKDRPMATGLLDYFPDALAEVARVSYLGNEQHNPGQPLHWAREKSTDHADCIIRHLAERGKQVKLGSGMVSHTAQAAWRALALLQEELEKGTPTPTGEPDAPRVRTAQDLDKEAQAAAARLAKRRMSPEDVQTANDLLAIATHRLYRDGAFAEGVIPPQMVIG